MKRKGQFVSMIAVVALLFISGGSIFTAMFAQETFGSHVNYYTRDTGHVLEAKVHGSFYNYTVKKEMNFTENNVAYAMRNADDNENYEWSDGSVPTYSSLKSTYTDRFLDGQGGLNGQIFVDDCSGPTLSMNSLTKDEISIEMSDKSIKCGYRDSYTDVYFARNNPNEKTLQVENVNNRWLRVAEASVDLGDGISSGNFDSDIPEGESRDGTDSFCENPDFDYSNPPPESGEDGFSVDASVKYWARGEARENFMDDYSGLAQTIFQDFDKNGHSWISANTQTVYPNRNNEDYTDNSITERDYNSCNADECSWSQFDEWEEEECDYNNNGDINWSNAEGDCMFSTNYDDNYSQCDYSEVENNFGTQIEAEATYEPEYVRMTFNLYDSNNQIRTKEGRKRARFKFNYTKDLN